MLHGQIVLEAMLEVLAEENKSDLTLFYPKDYIKRLEFIKKNIDAQIDKLILTEKENAIQHIHR